MGNKLNEFLRRITGFSSPVGGISWHVPQDEREVLYKLVQQLSDRRFLRRSHVGFDFYYILDSLSKMRENVTSALCELSPKSKTRLFLENIRAALHEFQSHVEYELKELRDLETIPSEELLIALESMRDVVGGNLYSIEQVLGVEVPSELKVNFNVKKPNSTD